MASCSCSGGCACIIKAGTGIDVTGAGTATSPYVIKQSLSSLTGAITVQDSPTVNLTVYGSGVPVSDPFVIRADVALKLSQLTDVQDPSGAPAVGESIVWVGAGSLGHWEFQTLPPAPAGSVNVSNGISGTGAVGTPIALATAAVWGTGELAGLGTDSTIGLPVYIDSAGKVRAKPVTISTVAWTAITGKPTSYPPSAHTHAASDITDPLNLNVGKINGARVTSTLNSTTAPATTSAGDLWFYPKGS